MTTKSPTLTEFLAVAHHAFAFLRTDFGFKELPSGPNAYSLRYAKADMVVSVEGINWGFGVTVTLKHQNNQIPLWAIATARGLQSAEGGDQLEQLRHLARLLYDAGRDALIGDVTIFPVALQIMEEELTDASAPKKHKLP